MLERARAEAARLTEAGAAEAQAAPPAASAWRWTASPPPRRAPWPRCAPPPPPSPPPAAQDVIARTHTAEADAGLVDSAIQGLGTALRAA
jgi:hypothetical protein